MNLLLVILACKDRNAVPDSSPPIPECHSVDGTIDTWAGEDNTDRPTFIDIDIGENQVCGITTEGTIQCWGDEEYPLPYDSNFVELHMDHSHACALDDEGLPCCWNVGDAGDTYPAPHYANSCSDRGSTYPRGPYELMTVNPTFACGVTEEAETWCWGDIFGNGTLLFSTPENPPVELSTSSESLFILHSDNRISLWYMQSDEPVALLLQADYEDREQMSLTLVEGFHSTASFAPNGSILATGGPGEDEDPTTTTWSPVAWWESGPDTVQTVASRLLFCARYGDGSVDCEMGHMGQIGNEWKNDSDPMDGCQFTDIALDPDDQGCGVTMDGTVACWGWLLREHEKFTEMP